MKRILLIGNCYTTIVHFRRELILKLVDEGYDVWMSFPNHSHGESDTGEDAAKELGCNFIELKLDRRSANIIKELNVIKNIKNLMKKVSPDCVLTYTIKPNLYGGYISQKMKIPYIVNVTGLGSGINNGVIGKILSKAYIQSCNRAEKVFFQNNKDLVQFCNNGLKNQKYTLLPGSGVNIMRYAFYDYPEYEKTIFLYDARIMKEKGIEEYLYAAEYFYMRDDIDFYICGDCEENYQQILEELSRKNVIRYFGRVSDVRPLIKECSCVVIPTFYNEGISNCLLEAAACGRPIISTNQSGCKEVIDNGVTGFLVRPKDKEDLLRALNDFLLLPREKKVMMGKDARDKVEREFDRRIVVNEYMTSIKSCVLAKD